jgi:glycosyltransferase involved in cell wall biosynthesis
MAARPSISVIIPTFNRARYLDLTLASYLGQSDRDFEIVIVDDGSTDDTADVVATYRDRVRLGYVHQANQGRSRARNAAIEHAQGDLVIFSDDDRIASRSFVAEHRREHLASTPRVVLGWQEGILSIWLPDLVIAGGTMVKLLARRPGLGEQLRDRETALITPAMIRDEFEATIADLSCPEPWQQKIAETIERHGLDLDGYCFPWRLGVTGNLSAPRALVRDVGMFDTGFRGWGLEDLDLHYRLHVAGAATRVSRTAVNYHQLHQRAQTLMYDWNNNALRLIEKYTSVELELYLRTMRGKLSLDEANRIALEYPALAAAGSAVAADYARLMHDHVHAMYLLVKTRQPG